MFRSFKMLFLRLCETLKIFSVFLLSAKAREGFQQKKFPVATCRRSHTISGLNNSPEKKFPQMMSIYLMRAPTSFLFSSPDNTWKKSFFSFTGKECDSCLSIRRLIFGGGAGGTNNERKRMGGGVIFRKGKEGREGGACDTGRRRFFLFWDCQKQTNKQ